MSDGRFSSKPIRAARPTGFTSAASFGMGDYSPDPVLPPDAAQAFLDSPAVQRVVNELMDDPYRVGGLPPCAPFPRRTPEGATDQGQPIASAVLVQEHLFGLIFLRIAGWLFLLFGLLLVGGSVVGFVAMLFQPPRPGADDNARMGMIFGALFGMGIMGAGLWFGILRGRVINQRCWFCPYGMVWMTENFFEWYGWEEVPELYVKLQAGRPAVGLCFFGNSSWVSFDDTDASRLIVQYIESRASASWMPETLESIAQGKTVHFGDRSLSRSAIDGLDVKNVRELQANERELVVRRNERDDLVIPLEAIPYPSLFTTLARAVYADANEPKA